MLLVYVFARLYFLSYFRVYFFYLFKKKNVKQYSALYLVCKYSLLYSQNDEIALQCVFQKVSTSLSDTTAYTTFWFWDYSCSL